MFPLKPVYDFFEGLDELKEWIQSGKTPPVCECEACLEDVEVDPLEEAREANWPWFEN